MTNVTKAYFITKEEAEALHPWIESTLPQYELEDGTKLYAYVQWIDTFSAPTYRTLEELKILKSRPR
jgi:hypothetical protein